MATILEGEVLNMREYSLSLEHDLVPSLRLASRLDVEVADVPTLIPVAHVSKP